MIWRRYQGSVGEVQSRTNWDPVWTGPNPTVPVQVWDFPKNTRPLGLQSGHSHISQDCLRPGLDQDRITYISNMLIFYFVCAQWVLEALALNHSPRSGEDFVHPPPFPSRGLPLCQCQCVTSIWLAPVLENLCIVISSVLASQSQWRLCPSLVWCVCWKVTTIY